ALSPFLEAVLVFAELGADGAVLLSLLGLHKLNDGCRVLEGEGEDGDGAGCELDSEMVQGAEFAGVEAGVGAVHGYQVGPFEALAIAAGDAFGVEGARAAAVVPEGDGKPEQEGG